MNAHITRSSVTAALFLGVLLLPSAPTHALPIGGHPDKCKGGVPDGAFSCLNGGGTVACTNDGDYMCCKKNSQGGQDCDQIETKTQNPLGSTRFPGGNLQVAPANPQPNNPRVPKAGMNAPIMRRGVDGEQPADTAPADKTGQPRGTTK